jgi:hypothetical protein
MIKCRIFKILVTDDPSSIQFDINKFLDSVELIVSVTQSPIGQGTALITIFYKEYGNTKKNRAGNAPAAYAI